MESSDPPYQGQNKCEAKPVVEAHATQIKRYSRATRDQRESLATETSPGTVWVTFGLKLIPEMLIKLHNEVCLVM